MNTPRRQGARPLLRRQRGVTLIVALIMLVLLTLLALTSFNLGNSNLQIVSNMQQRNEAVAAAQEVIEEAISSTRFFQSPDDALGNPCGGANQRCIDTNGDGTPDVTVALARPVCAKVQTVKNSSLDLAQSENAGCVVSQVQNFGTSGAVTGDSLCADSVWELHATATDNVTEASVEVTQGVAVRVAKDDIATNCP
jgi:Tfp pilus assembly protein PilX